MSERIVVSGTKEQWDAAVYPLEERISDLKRYLKSDPNDPDYPRMDYGYLEALAECESLLEAINQARGDS